MSRGRFTKSCTRDGCHGIVRRRSRGALAKGRYCSIRCANLGRGLQANPRVMPAGLDDRDRAVFRVGYKRGYNAGWAAQQKRWASWLEVHPVNTWRGHVTGPRSLRGAA